MSFRKRRRSTDGDAVDGAAEDVVGDVAAPRVGRKTIEISMQEKRIAGVSIVIEKEYGSVCGLS